MRIEYVVDLLFFLSIHSDGEGVSELLQPVVLLHRFVHIKWTRKPLFYERTSVRFNKNLWTSIAIVLVRHVLFFPPIPHWFSVYLFNSIPQYMMFVLYFVKINCTQMYVCATNLLLLVATAIHTRVYCHCFVSFHPNPQRFLLWVDIIYWVFSGYHAPCTHKPTVVTQTHTHTGFMIVCSLILWIHRCKSRIFSHHAWDFLD